MVNGLDLFRQHFADFTDRYVLIGGCACDIHFSSVPFPFRVTKDLDIVLCVEALDADFVRVFWDFIRKGAYEIRQKSNGNRQFYRFMRPQNTSYPAMLELFSRKPDGLRLPEGGHLTPIPIDEEVSSLSAILLNDDYYKLLMETRGIYDGVSLAPMQTLIVLKAKAWMDLKHRKDSGEDIDSKNIRKHRNDIVRLAANVISNAMQLPPAIIQDMTAFLREYEEELPEPEAIGLPLKASDIMDILYRLFLPSRKS